MISHKGHDPRQYLTLIFFFILLFAPGPLRASEPTLTFSVSGDEGYIDITVQATFPNYEWCQSGECETKNDGYLKVGAFKHFGNGSVSYTWTSNAALMSSDPKMNDYTASACGGYPRTCITKTEYVPIDYTPEVTITGGPPEGYMDIHGTYDFKDNPTGHDGSLALINHINHTQIHSSSPGTWSFEDLAGYNYNAATKSQGPKELTIKAGSAFNRFRTSATYAFTIDNTPEPKITGYGDFPDHTMEIYGTVTFKENPEWHEGVVILYIKTGENGKFVQHGKILNHEGKHMNWTYSDFTGHRLNPPADYFEVKIVARAYNGAVGESIDKKSGTGCSADNH